MLVLRNAPDRRTMTGRIRAKLGVRGAIVNCEYLENPDHDVDVAHVPVPRCMRCPASSCQVSPGQVTYNHMVVQKVERQAVDQIFAALADATRRDIVTRVLRDEASVSALARHYDMSFAAVQKHIAVLERAHLVTKRRHGREQLVSGDVTTIRAAARLLGKYEQIWRGRIGRIEEILTQPPGGEAT